MSTFDQPADRRSASAAGHTPTAAFDDELAARLLHQRIVVLGQEVDDAVANRVCAQLLLLSAEDARADVTLCLNSPGGSVSAALAMYDVMRLVPNDVATLVMGMAASAAQFLLSAGTPGKRYALRHARVLMHQPSGAIGGTAIDVAIQAQNLLHTKRTMQHLIAEHTHHDDGTIERDSDRDRWFSAEEALDYGFVDRVVDRWDDVRPAGVGRRAGL